MNINPNNLRQQSKISYFKQVKLNSKNRRKKRTKYTAEFKTKLVFGVYEYKTTTNAVDFLKACKAFYPFATTNILTDNALEYWYNLNPDLFTREPDMLRKLVFVNGNNVRPDSCITT